MNILALFSAFFILVGTWQLAAGKLKSGNLIMLAGTILGTGVNLIAEIWPFILLNVILFWRSGYILSKMEWKK